MRTRSIMLLALALGCGLVAAIGISQVMDARRQGPDLGERQPVFVALLDINPNEELTAQNIKLEEWPKNIVPQGALTKLEEVEGKRSRLKVYAGEPILASKLLGANDEIGAAKDIPPGYRVAHVRVDPVSGSSNLILPGDRVDVIVFKHPNNDQNATAAKIVLQDVKVFAVDTFTETQFTATKNEQTEPMTAKAISLLVTPQQAVILHAASEMGGAVRLVLRNPEDDVHVAAEGATLSDIFGPDGQKTNRDAEKNKTAAKDDEKITDWLAQETKEAPAATPKTSPYPQAPPLPVNRRKMIVVLGAELVQVEIPGDGEPPLNQPQGGGSSGSTFSPADEAPIPPAEEEPAGEQSGDDETEEEASGN